MTKGTKKLRYKDPKRPVFRKIFQKSEILKALKEGLSYREIREKVGASVNTIQNLRQYIKENDGEIWCACGLPTSHRGWCKFRFDRHPLRQAVMHELHLKQSGGKLKDRIAI